MRRCFWPRKDGCGGFVFLDPTDNLLRWSETLTSGVWQKDALLQLSAGVNDPVESTRATRVANTGLVSQELSQSVEAAGWFQYCFSVFASVLPAAR